MPDVIDAVEALDSVPTEEYESPVVVELAMG